MIQGGHDIPHNDHILALSVKMSGAAGKKALGGIDGSSTDMGMGLLTLSGGGGSNEPMGFSGVLGAASIVDGGEGADDDSSENDVN